VIVIAIKIAKNVIKTALVKMAENAHVIKKLKNSEKPKKSNVIAIQNNNTKKGILKSPLNLFLIGNFN